MARSLQAGVGLRACADLDLLVVCSGVARGLSVLEPLPAQLRMPVEVMVIEETDLAQGIVAGDVQIISLLSETLWVRAPARIRAYQRRVLRSQAKSGDREFQKLLSFALETCTQPSSARQAKAAMIASAQALALSTGVQPRGTSILFGEILPRLLADGLAPCGASRALARLNAWAPARARIPPAEVRAWVNEAAIFTLRNASRAYFSSPSEAPGLQAILLDLGGTLLREDDGCIAPFALALEILQAWSGRFRLAAVSNAPCSLQAKMDQLGLSRFFEAMLLSQELGAFKPESAVYAAALSRLGVAAPTALMIGDTLETDVFGPWRSGIRAIWIQPTFAGTQRMESWGAIAPDLAAAARLLYAT
ncbi:MAG: HAD family hydrolase [Burkholderiales bacterium]|nr:HAD family hydrolase [Burkholderiales bacterium]